MRVLFAGLGGIGQRHLRNLRQLLGDRVEVLAWRQRGLKRTLTEKLQVEAGADVETKYGVAVVPELEPALDSVDVVFVCNPTRAHVPVALAAARSGCHLFLEKPVSDSWEGLDDLSSLVQAKRLVTLVGYQMRFHPLLIRLQALVQEAAVGNLVAVRAEIGESLPGFHRYEDYRLLYASRKELGGGVILSQIHELDYLYSLFGLPRHIFALEDTSPVWNWTSKTSPASRWSFSSVAACCRATSFRTICSFPPRGLASWWAMPARSWSTSTASR